MSLVAWGQSLSIDPQTAPAFSLTREGEQSPSTLSAFVYTGSELNAEARPAFRAGEQERRRKRPRHGVRRRASGSRTSHSVLHARRAGKPASNTGRFGCLEAQRSAMGPIAEGR